MNDGPVLLSQYHPLFTDVYNCSLFDSSIPWIVARQHTICIYCYLIGQSDGAPLRGRADSAGPPEGSRYLKETTDTPDKIHGTDSLQLSLQSIQDQLL